MTPAIGEGCAKLQTQFARRIVIEQLAFADITPHHLHRFVADLTHDRPFAGAVARGLRGKPAAQAVRAETRSIESSGFAPTLHDQSDHLCSDGGRPDAAMAVDGAKDGAGGKCF